MTTLQEIEASVARIQTKKDPIADRFAKLTTEIDPRMADDSTLLRGSPSLEILYQTKLSWQDFEENLSVLSRELTQLTSSLDEELARLKQLDKSWQTTLQTARGENLPPQVLASLQEFVGSIEQTRQVVDNRRGEVLTELSQVLEEETRVRKILMLVDETQVRALKDLLVRDGPFIWSPRAGLGTEWEDRSGVSFASQLKAATAFGKRLPLAFFIHGSLIFVLAIGLRWMRRAVQNRAKVKPELSRALPILDLPIATAFVLTVLVSHWIYPEAPRLIRVLLGTLGLIPAVLILQRLLDRNFSSLLYFLVAMYFIDQLRVLAASLPELVRVLFLAQMLGASLFLFWLLRSRQLAVTVERTSPRFAKAVQAICVIGLILLPAAILADILGYLKLAYLLGTIFFRSVYMAALMYTAIRILEGLIIIALEVRPLSSLRVVSLHRSLLLTRACGFFEFVALLCWLNLMLGFFGLWNPLFTAIQGVLNASITIGSISVSLGGILAFSIAIWASFLVSRFVRFVLEEDVYSHLLLERGIPYAISTMLHYAILLVGVFVALGALGIDLTKITILAGAFSVGIGFGLQNVINNFVSGLILLFERPIKIGDIIEVSGNIGEVRRIGIRASIIRTADGSEVIVPNGLLISGQVTNWTLTDQGRAVEVSISVAASADPRRVAELLKSIAAAHPDVAKEPAPRVHVVSMTASAIAYQLRVWTDRHEAWAQVRSDLTLAINEALVREKIALA
jgi:small-conductance mechanosensitive channel